MVHRLVVVAFHFRTTFFRLWEWVMVLVTYYPRSPLFGWADLLLTLEYIWKNPHRVYRDTMRQVRSADPYTFGETPLTTLAYIAKECGLLSRDSFYELGCGHGRTCIWMRCFVGCKVTGIDHLPLFIQKGNKVLHRSGLCGEGIRLLCADMLTTDLSRATAVYLYGICLEDEVILQLVESLCSLPPRAKVITISYPLTDYNHTAFQLLKQFTARFPWGKAEVFLQERQSV